MIPNLLIVGAHSYVGRHFLEAVRLHARTQPASESPTIYPVSSQECDLLDDRATHRLLSSLGSTPCTVVLFAVINKSARNTYESFLDNVSMIRNFVNAQTQANIQSIVYLSSVDVYGTSLTLPITENSAINPGTWYGLAKYSCEWTLFHSSEIRCPVTVARIPGAFGKGLRDQSVIGKMVESARTQGKITLSGDGSNLRDYVWLEDIAQVLMQLIPLRLNGVVNLVTGQSLSVLTIAHLVRAALGDRCAIVHQEEDPARQFDLVFDNQKLRSLLPRFQFNDLRRGIASYL